MEWNKLGLTGLFKFLAHPTLYTESVNQHYWSTHISCFKNWHDFIWFKVWALRFGWRVMITPNFFIYFLKQLLNYILASLNFYFFQFKSLNSKNKQKIVMIRIFSFLSFCFHIFSLSITLSNSSKSFSYLCKVLLVPLEDSNHKVCKFLFSLQI